MKSYKIETIQDMLKAVTSENIDGFLTDFESFLRMVVIGKEMAPGVIDLEEVKFTWNDDGDYGTLKKVTITVKDEK